MDHHVLRPTLASITDSTLDLSNLVAAVVELFDLPGVGVTEQSQASCAAKVYLAIVYAFEKKGYMQITHAPDLWLDIGTGAYEITLSNPTDPLKELSKLDAREQGDVDSDASSDVHMDWSRGLGATSGGGGRPSLQALKGLNRLGSLDLDTLQFRTSITINWEYWRLGNAYARFCEANALPGRPWFVKEEQARMFKMVAQAWSLDARASQAVRKRLQRARKFWFLVQKFGTAVLNAVPQVSVSKVDRLRLDDFHERLPEVAIDSVVAKQEAQVQGWEPEVK